METINTLKMLNEMICAKEEYYKSCFEFGIKLKDYLALINKFYEAQCLLSEEIKILENISLENNLELFENVLNKIKFRQYNLNLGKFELYKYEKNLEVLRQKRSELHKKCLEVYVSYDITDTDKLSKLVDSLDSLNLKYTLDSFEITETNEEKQKNKLKGCFSITSNVSFIESCENQSIEEVKQKNQTINNSVRLINLIIKTRQIYEQKLIKLEEELNYCTNTESQIQTLESLFDNNASLLKDKNKSIIIKLFKKSEIEELKGIISDLNSSLDIENSLFIQSKNRLKEKTQETLGFYNIYNSMCEMLDCLIEDLQEDELKKLMVDLKIVIPKTEDNYFNEELEMKKQLKEFLLNRIDLVEYCKDNKLDIEDSNFIKTKRYIKQPLVSENN